MRRESTATRFSLVWAHASQRFSRGHATFEHVGPVDTAPSHDVCHLLVAACSDLPWLPVGDREDVCLAEYNAVLLEHLMHGVYVASVLGRPLPEPPLAAALCHVRWFVDEHYRPFPLAEAQARERFRRRVDADAVTRLSPFYFAAKAREGEDRREAHFLGLRFAADDAPPCRARFRDAQRAVRGELHALPR